MGGSDLICAKATTGNSNVMDKANAVKAREIQLRLLEVFVKKFKVLSEYHLPLIFRKCEELAKSTESNDDKSGATKSNQDQIQSSASSVELMNPESEEPGEGGGDSGAKSAETVDGTENEENEKDTAMSVDEELSKTNQTEGNSANQKSNQ